MGFLSKMIAVAVYVATASCASFAATAEQRSSILIFPRVVAGEQRDTVIQLVNSSFLTTYARCFYVGVVGEAEETTFIELDLRLSSQQTTHWSASRGRPDDPSDPPCRGDDLDCYGAGFDPGEIPAVPAGFEGRLVCVQVDASGAAWSGNALLGGARILDQSGSAQSYAAIGLRGFDTNNGDAVLCLGGEVRSDCPKGAEYDACPTRWFATHPTDDPNDAASGTATSMTLVPCDLDLERRLAPELTVTFQVTNELEQTLSASTTVERYGSFALRETSVVFGRDLLGAGPVNTAIGSPRDEGFVGVAEVQTMEDGTITAVRLHGDSTQTSASLIELPE